jgi:adenylyl-sulfate kinase
MIIWLTGLPCSGKTTLAHELRRKITGDGMVQMILDWPVVEVLDGDELRGTAFAQSAGFTKQDRHNHLLRVGYLAQRLNRYVPYVICSFVAPFEETRRLLPADLIVYVKCSADTCAKRDVKGMWARASRGEIKDFTGVDAPYEVPEHPDVTVDTETMSIRDCVSAIMAAIQLKSHERAHVTA